MISVRCAAVALISVVIGGAFSACSRRSADPGGIDVASIPAARNRKAAARIMDQIILSRELGLVEAAQVGDLKQVELRLARRTDHNTLNEALFAAAGISRLDYGQQDL
jgi:hypothetical protein